jgi:AcrR family transcriptional regulator
METTPQLLSRTERKKRRTRAQLLEAAYSLMSTKGVDSTAIAEITELADTGFGTFYNYFKTKDDIAIQVLDCVIHDLGRRNDEATAALKGANPAAVQAISIRITMREMLTNPIWRWWLRRPDMLAERLRVDFHRYGVRDLKIALEAGRYDIAPEDVEALWSQQMWMLAGGVKDMLDSNIPGLTEQSLIAAIMRAMGLEPDRALELAALPLPAVGPPRIDFSAPPPSTAT